MGGMGYPPRMGDFSEKERIAELEARVVRQEARLGTYKESLSEIYSLYSQSLEELSFIRRLSDSLRLSLDLKKVCLAILRVIMDELGPDGCLLFLRGRADQVLLKGSAELGGAIVFHPDKDPVQKDIGSMLAGPVEDSLITGRSVLVPDLESHPGLRPGPSGGLLGRAGSLICLPLISRRETLGVLVLVGFGGGDFTEKDIRVLTIIADQAAAALYGVRLITQVRRASRSVRISEKRARLALDSLERLLENANDLILTLDRKGRITYVNRQSRELGLEPDKLLGQPFSAVINAPEFDPGGADPQAAWSVEELELRPSAGDETGPVRTALVSFTPLPPGDRNDPAWLVIAREITERKQLERQLFHSEKLASVGLLAAGVAHEIGNPLSAISGYAQILSRKKVAQEDRVEFAAAVHQEAGRIEKIIQDLLTYSRPASGVRTRLRLNEAVESVLSLLTNQKLFRKITLEIRPDPADPEVFMDRDHLAQVLVNLVLNAAQAMDGAGAIRVGIESGPKTAILTVADQGPGISPQAAARIFDPFFTTKAIGQGTGLGLSICHRLVEGEGGLIRLGESDGPGATFEVVLPRAREEM